MPKSKQYDICGGIFSSGKCVLTKSEYKKLGLQVKSNVKRIICVNGANECGECDMILRKGDKIK